jgi:hypothetical protein
MYIEAVDSAPYEKCFHRHDAEAATVVWVT